MVTIIAASLIRTHLVEWLLPRLMAPQGHCDSVTNSSINDCHRPIRIMKLAMMPANTNRGGQASNVECFKYKCVV